MNFVLKALGTGVSIGAGLLASKLLDVVWKRATGKDSPKKDDDMENSLRSVLVFAVVSGAVSAIIRVLSQRGTQHAIARFSKTRDIV
ncbi:DUF4235 domain-containing protein [Arthrobacter sp. I2-34]|uniref:DUF4235 domain-containing protein n=1 Tax=Arthrobacter hankyongi TaxID=2904801 RepID=A0ABS9L9D7_9MICC|nr:DUF4235 domain-containing protein [Arthrobacter hankyongi]MCG2623211.1 DUF4235 domain-containing protein [Arthrobacter hankyongi]